MPKLDNRKQEQFCQEYLADFNGAQAAIRAGYSVRTARTIAYELLTKPHIQARVQELQNRRNERADIHADAVLAEVKKIAFATIGNYVRKTPDGGIEADFTEADEAALAALDSIQIETKEIAAEGENVVIERQVKFKLQPKLQALVKLGEHLNLWKSEREKTADAMSAALAEINQRGSAAPVSGASE